MDNPSLLNTLYQEYGEVLDKEDVEIVARELKTDLRTLETFGLKAGYNGLYFPNGIVQAYEASKKH